MINIQSDSRKIKPGDTFVAVKCEVNDGHKYIENAIVSGASKIVAEHGNYSVPTIIVDDSRKYLNDYLKENYNKYLDEMTLIGLTGTNGKTTTAYLLYQALNKFGMKTAYIGTIGFYLDKKIESLPNTSVDICDMYDLLIRAYDAGYKTVIIENSSHALFNGRVKTIRYDYALFTNLTQDHLDFHKTMENYALAKQKLFRMLKQNGKAIINCDDSYKDYFLLPENNNITFGFSDSDYQIISDHMDNQGTEFIYKHDGKEYVVKTKLLGDYNVYNSLGAVATMIDMGFDPDRVNKVMNEITAPPGRIDTVNYKTNAIIIDYAHTPDAIENIINTTKKITQGNIYIVFGCTGDRDRTKRPIMTNIATKNAKYVIITSDDQHDEEFSQIVDDMTKDIKATNYEVIESRRIAINKAISMLNEHDTLLILGKGHEEFIIMKNNTRIPFNDKECVLEILSNLEKSS
jgi:UDP-N-acetylmuramoyl-L-alanyl-D-glutamate--2,6-diaminopimelate ligase